MIYFHILNNFCLKHFFLLFIFFYSNISTIQKNQIYCVNTFSIDCTVSLLFYNYCRYYRKNFSKRYPFRKTVSFPQNQFSEQNRKVSSIGFESEDYMLHGQRALWPGYPCSNGKLPFSHCQRNIAESTKLEVTATLVFLLFPFSFFSTQQQIYAIRWRVCLL